LSRGDDDDDFDDDNPGDDANDDEKEVTVVRWGDMVFISPPL